MGNKTIIFGILVLTLFVGISHAQSLAQVSNLSTYPEILIYNITPNSSQTQTWTIINQGSSNFNLSICCSNRTLSFNPTNFTINPYSTKVIHVTFNSSGFQPGQNFGGSFNALIIQKYDGENINKYSSWSAWLDGFYSVHILAPIQRTNQSVPINTSVTSNNPTSPSSMLFAIGIVIIVVIALLILFYLKHRT